MPGVFAYFDPDTNATVYHVLPDAESDNSTSTLQSEIESISTGTTIESDEVPGYFVLHHGRQQPASENIVRWLLPDNIRRHISRYIVNNWLFGGDYVGPVKEVLAPLAGRKRQALELGTRTGTWIQSVAAEFPHVQFRSLDVVPIMAHVPRPNIIFEIYDFTEGLLLEDNSQDVVFLNSIMEVVKDYHALLREVHRVLRPGGLIHVYEPSRRTWDSQTPTVPAQRTNSIGSRFEELAQGLLVTIGADPDTCDKVQDWLAPGSAVWGPGSSNRMGFERIQSVVRMCPAYPHPGFPCMDELDTRVASFLSHLTVMTVRDLLGVIKDRGVRDEEAARLIEDMIDELKQHERSYARRSKHLKRHA